MPSYERIIGIDPGLRHTGYGAIESDGRSSKYIDSGVISPSVKDPLGSRLLYLSEQLQLVLEKLSPTQIVVEDVFVSVNAKTTLLLGYARGVCICEAYRASTNVFTYSPREIKLSVVGKGGAVKSQVQYMVKVLLGTTTTYETDASDALAGALCHAHRYVSGIRQAIKQSHVR